MTPEEIIEGNKLIAKFMGGHYFPNGAWSEWNFPDGTKPTKLYYHSSWDWLMPVVKKIFDLNNMDKLYSRLNKVTEAMMFIDVQILFEEVVKFIKWYNQHNK